MQHSPTLSLLDYICRSLVSSRLLTQYLLPTGQYSDDTRWIIGAVAAVFSVQLILGVFSYVAYCDEAKNWADKQRLKEKAEEEWKNRKKVK